MKKSLLILSVIAFLFGCKKEDYIETHTGTYKGSANYYNGPTGNHWTEDATVNVDKGEEENILVLTGDVLSVMGEDPPRLVVTIDSQADTIIYADMEFRGDSLLFSMYGHHFFTHGTYKLKRQ